MSVLLLAFHRARPEVGDWPHFFDWSKEMTGGLWLRIFAERPGIQSGPVNLVAVRLLYGWGPNALTLIVIALALVTLWCVDRFSSAAGHPFCFMIGGSILMWWWPFLKVMGHLDDAIVITIAAAAMLLVQRGRRVPAAVLIGVALLTKPWVVLLVPVTWIPGERRWRGWRHPALSVGVAAIGWTPFVLADPAGTMAGVRPQVWLARDGVLRTFWEDQAHAPTSLLRILQLVLATAVVMIAVKRRRWSAVILGGLGVRLMLDPATWNYYTVGLLLGTLLWDVRPGGRRLPWASIGVAFALPPTWIVEDPGQAVLRSTMRLAACLVAIGLAVWPDRRERRVTTVGQSSQVDDSVDEPPYAFSDASSTGVRR